MKNVLLLILASSLMITSCNKSNETETYKVGVYKPYKQEVSSIFARTENGIVDGSQIKLSSASVINGTGNTGDIHFRDIGSDPLRETEIRIDSIKIATKGKAIVYPNFFKNSLREVVRVHDSLFLIPTDTTLAFIRFYPCCTNPVIITDNQKVSLYMTTKGKFLTNGFLLFHYDIFIKSASYNRFYGSLNADYLDIDYLTDQLGKSDTLIYVKRTTYFKID